MAHTEPGEAQSRAGEQHKPRPASPAGPGKDTGLVSSISPSLGDISSQLLLPPRLSMSGGGGDLLLECFGSGSPSNVGAVTTGKVPKEALLNRSWLGACCFQLCPEPAWEREVPESCPGWAPGRAGTNPRRSIRSPRAGSGSPGSGEGSGTSWSGARPCCTERGCPRGAEEPSVAKSLAKPFVSPQMRACTNNDGTIPARHIDPVL